MKPNLCVLTGPTAVGKTSLSISLAKQLNTEIISADSMQVYKNMDIGTAKILPDEMMGIKHYMIDICDFREDYDVFSFQEKVKPIIQNMIKEEKIPLIVGGTGFYIQAVVYDVDFSKNSDKSYREFLNEIAKTKGADALYEMLKDVDMEYSKITHKNNVKRVIRALEFYKSEGYPLSQHNNKEKSKSSPYNLFYFVLTKNREDLYKDINKRVDIMMEEGFLSEVEKLYKSGLKRNTTAGKALGYSELIGYLEKEYSLEEAIEKIKLNTRHFAKRQLTWFRREKDVIWINKDDFNNNNEILEFIMEKINGK